MGQIYVTWHAAERFVERITEGEVASLREARRILVQEIHLARPIRATNSAWIYRSDALECEFVIVPDPDPHWPLRCVTTLLDGEVYENDWLDERLYGYELELDARLTRKRMRAFLRTFSEV